MMVKEMWKDFNLGDNNIDVGGGILYCLRYDFNHLKRKQEQIINCLLEIVDIEDKGEGYAVKLRTPKNQIAYHPVLLLEELSVLNDAIHYSEMGLDQYKNISELKNGLMHYYSAIIGKDIVEAYDFVDRVIPEIVKDIHIADIQNGVLNQSERKSLEELASFAKDKVRQLNNPRGIVILGF